MSTVTVAAYMQQPIRPHKWIRNGKYPDATLQAELARHMNAGAIIRLKEHCSFSAPIAYDLTEVEPRERWHFTFRTSAFARYLWSRMALAIGSNSAPETPKQGKLYVLTTDGDVVATATLGAAGSSDANPSNWRHGDVPLLDALGQLWECAPYTTYHAYFEDGCDSYLIGASLWEWGALDETTENGLVGGNTAAGTPILDEDREAVAELGSLLWRQQGSHLANWAKSIGARLIPRTYESPGTGFKNLISDVENDFGPDGPAYRIDLRDRARVSEAATVRVRVWVRGGLTQVQGGLDEDPQLLFKLFDSSGTELCAIDFHDTTPQWKSTGTITLPATLASYYLAGDVTGQTEGTSWAGEGGIWGVSIVPDDDG